jgi:hypothetical protein
LLGRVLDEVENLQPELRAAIETALKEWQDAHRRRVRRRAGTWSGNASEGRYVIQLSPTTNPNAARADADHTIVVPPEDRTIVVPPPTPDDCVVVLPDGQRWWVSLPPPVRAVLPHALRAEGARKPRRLTLSSVAKQARKAAIAVARYEVKPDGSIVIVTTEGEPEKPGNELDVWMAKRARSTERH